MGGGMKDSFQVEWVNVTYRSIGVIVATLLIGALGAGGVWFYFDRYAPREDAASAIENARARYLEAAKLAGADTIKEAVATAKASLEDSERHFDDLDYANAKVAAIRSENLSIQALAEARGEEASDRRVRFYEIEGDVRVKPKGAFAWKKADSRMVLRVGDQVKTSSSSSAKLIYFDGTLTTIQPGSLMEIRDLFEDPVTKVRRVRERLTFGEVQTSTQKRNVQGSYHEIATEKVTARADDAGEFRVAYHKEQKTSTFDVFSGAIEVASNKNKTRLDAGQRVTARSDGRLSHKKALPGTPVLEAPPDQRVFIFDDPGKQSITLVWQAVSGSDGYQLMVSDRSLFTNPLYSGLRDENTASIAGVEEGAYYWKVAAVSADGTIGPFSEPRRFRVTSQQIRDRSDVDPPPLTIDEFVPVGQMVIINGKTEPGATVWIDQTKISVYEDGSFNAVVRLREEGLNELAIVAQDTAGNQTRKARSAYVETF